MQILRSRADRTARERSLVVYENERLHARLEAPCARDLRVTREVACDGFA